MKIAAYPGSFDPLTNGHLDIIKRASRLFDEVHVIVSMNISKKYSFNETERVEMIRRCTKDISNIKVVTFDGLIMNYCKNNKVDILIRGIRNFKDYEDEFALNYHNKQIYSNIETVILLPDINNQFISSSVIKELVHFDCDISNHVPNEIMQDIISRLKKDS